MLLPRPWHLAECTLKHIRDSQPSVAVLPFGATEPHNLHLPYGTDTYEADAIAGESCRRALERGANVICLPSIPYGTETNQAAFPFAMNLQPSTLLAILRDLTNSLAASGIDRLLIVNSHGGNEFKGHLRELFLQTPVHLFLCNWFSMFRSEYHTVFRHGDDHGGEMETSLIQYLRPELVKTEWADDGAVRESRFEAVRNGWVTLTRPWHLLTTNSGAGNPHEATAEKGKRWLEKVTNAIADFLVELASSPVDDVFPFQR